MSKVEIKETTFYVVHSWMNTRLQLKSVERDIYAIILGYSQDGESYYYGSLDYASRLTGYSRQAIIDALKSLVDKNYIIRDQISAQKVRYKVNLELIETSKSSLPVQNKSSKSNLPDKYETSKSSLQNNKYSNIKNKIDSLIDDFEHTLVVQETPSGGSEGSGESIAKRHNTTNNPYVYLSDEERDIMRNELAQYGEFAYLSTLREFNNCNKNLIDDGLNPYAKGIDGFRRYIERCGVSTVDPNAPLKVRI